MTEDSAALTTLERGGVFLTGRTRFTLPWQTVLVASNILLVGAGWYAFHIDAAEFDAKLWSQFYFGPGEGAAGGVEVEAPPEGEFGAVLAILLPWYFVAASLVVLRSWAMLSPYAHGVARPLRLHPLVARTVPPFVTVPDKEQSGIRFLLLVGFVVWLQASTIWMVLERGIP